MGIRQMSADGCLCMLRYALVRMSSRSGGQPAHTRRDHERRAEGRRMELGSLGQFRTVEDSWGQTVSD